MTRVYYKDANACIIMFDLTQRSTFDNAVKWKKDLDAKCTLPDGQPVPCVLLANKVSCQISTQIPSVPPKLKTIVVLKLPVGVLHLLLRLTAREVAGLRRWVGNGTKWAKRAFWPIRLAAARKWNARSVFRYFLIDSALLLNGSAVVFATEVM